MNVSFHIDEALEQTLRRELGDLNQAAKEALLVEAYRLGTLTHYQLAQALGLDRFQTEALLKRHQVTEDLQSLEDLEADRQNIDRVLGPVD